MCASRRSAVWPQVVAVALMALGTAGLSDSGRFSDFGDDRPPRGEATGSIPQPTNRVESQHTAASGEQWR